MTAKDLSESLVVLSMAAEFLYIHPHTVLMLLYSLAKFTSGSPFGGSNITEASRCPETVSSTVLKTVSR